MHGVGVAAAGRNHDLDARSLGGVERGEIARADAAIVAEQRTIHIDGDYADGAGLSFCLQDVFILRCKKKANWITTCRWAKVRHFILPGE
jgi:hypothetical protein